MKKIILFVLLVSCVSSFAASKKRFYEYTDTAVLEDDAEILVFQNNSSHNISGSVLKGTFRDKTAVTGILKGNGNTISAAVPADFPTLNQNTTGNAATVTTNANLTGEVTSVGNTATLSNAAVIGKVLSGYVSGPGTVSAADTILQSIQKINGNVALKVPNASPNNLTTVTVDNSGALIRYSDGAGDLNSIGVGPNLVGINGSGIGLYSGTGGNTLSSTYRTTVIGPLYTQAVTGTSFNGITGLSATMPSAHGTATIGNLSTAAKADHIHPTQKDQTTITGILKGNGSTISAAVAGTDYLTPGGSAALLTNFPTLNQNTTGNAASSTTAVNATNTTIVDDPSSNITAYPTWVTTTTGNLPQKTSSTKMFFNPASGTLTTTNYAGNHNSGSIASVVTATTQAPSANNATIATTQFVRSNTQPVGATALITGPTITLTPAVTTSIFTLVPDQSCTINASTTITGQQFSLIVTTAGTNDYTISFGTNLRSMGPLSTGTTTAKTFVLQFVCSATNQCNEVSRTVDGMEYTADLENGKRYKLISMSGVIGLEEL